MFKTIFLIFFEIVFVSHCIGQEKFKNYLEKIPLENCNGKSIELLLPNGSKKSASYSYEEGSIEVYTYSDKSYVMILCGANADLFNSLDKAKNRYYRKEVIKGIQISFGNVKSKRLEIFNISFDQMKKK